MGPRLADAVRVARVKDRAVRVRRGPARLGGSRDCRQRRYDRERQDDDKAIHTGNLAGETQSRA